MTSLLLFGFNILSSPAHAASCDSWIKKGETAQGAALADAFSGLVRCDKAVAEASYVKFMANAKDADALVGLSMVAIDGEVWTPVWSMIGKISSYEARDEVAERIGAACMEHPKIVSFLEGAYFGLRDIDFAQWDDAFGACESPELLKWMTDQVENPPKKAFDDKFDTVARSFAQRLHAEALPHLAVGAIAASKDGPFDAILGHMDAAVSPQLGEQMNAEDQKALEAALVKVAQGVGPAQSRAVADRLAGAGAEAAAARLLPVIFPDRVQSDGAFLYGGASIELAECKGAKTAVIHYAALRDTGARWTVQQVAEKPLQGFKAKLDKCTAEGPWPTAVSPEPLKSASEADAWIKDFEKTYADKGYAVTLRREKDLTLP